MNSDSQEKHWDEDPGAHLLPTAPLMGWDREGRDLVVTCIGCGMSAAHVVNGFCMDCVLFEPDGGKINHLDHEP